MPLGTLDRTPPPFFRQGHSALSKLVFFAALSLFMMVADARFDVTSPLRAVLATVLQPVERGLLVPVRAVQGMGEYVEGLDRAIASEASAREQLALQSATVSRVGPLEQENVRLRALLDLRPNLEVRSVAAQVLYEAADPYSRKVVLDRGTTQGIVAGSPVVNEMGVLGQVTRVFPLSSEVTLLTDKDAAIPVLNTRTQHRGAAFGNSSGPGLELRFMVGNADVNVGDELVTSGVDGVYPPGVPVAKVVSIDRRAETGFARITLAPTAVPDDVRHVLVLQPIGLQLPPGADLIDLPPPAAGNAKVPGTGGSKGRSAASGRAAASAASAPAATAAGASGATPAPAAAAVVARPATSVPARAASMPTPARAPTAPTAPFVASAPRSTNAPNGALLPRASSPAPRSAASSAPGSTPQRGALP